MHRQTYSTNTLDFDLPSEESIIGPLPEAFEFRLIPCLSTPRPLQSCGAALSIKLRPNVYYLIIHMKTGSVDFVQGWFLTRLANHILRLWRAKRPLEWHFGLMALVAEVMGIDREAENRSFRRFSRRGQLVDYIPVQDPLTCRRSHESVREMYVESTSLDNFPLVPLPVVYQYRNSKTARNALQVDDPQ